MGGEWWGGDIHQAAALNNGHQHEMLIYEDSRFDE